ncbi:glycosyltransferase, partial [Candidatus Bathyarchaeota archaeon]|nr:glycosyltransferase [Candidatus Bathyarchaeota archaeon]
MSYRNTERLVEAPVPHVEDRTFEHKITSLLHLINLLSHATPHRFEEIERKVSANHKGNHQNTRVKRRPSSTTPRTLVVSASRMAFGLTLTIGAQVLLLISSILLIGISFGNLALGMSTTVSVAIMAAKHPHLRPHAILALLYCGTILAVRQFVGDGALVWFIAIFLTRYARLAMSLYGFWMYKLATAPANPTVSRRDVTLVIPTVSCSDIDNEDFEECLTTCLVNLPAELMIVTDTEARAEQARSQLKRIQKKLKVDISKVKCKVMSAGIASKRCQLECAIAKIRTSLTLFVDDHVFLPGKFINSVIPAFEDPRVGFCGTNKDVRHLPSQSATILGRYFEAFWNVMGAVYLARHNFEIRASNALDGGVFVVSGRASVIRTNIIKDPDFLDGLKNERFLFGMLPPNGLTHRARLFASYVFRQNLSESDYSAGLGPDDDNFITRWVVGKGWDVKIQYSDATKIETTLGTYPKFIQQCLRWSRTTIRSNPASLTTD